MPKCQVMKSLCSGDRTTSPCSTIEGAPVDPNKLDCAVKAQIAIKAVRLIRRSKLTRLFSKKIEASRQVPRGRALHGRDEFDANGRLGSVLQT
jgi:hypothetical protein